MADYILPTGTRVETKDATGEVVKYDCAGDRYLVKRDGQEIWLRRWEITVLDEREKP